MSQRIEELIVDLDLYEVWGGTMAKKDIVKGDIVITDRLLTDVQSVRRALREGCPHYVYVLCRPSGEPFYVGKGVKGRVLDHEAEARNTRRLTHKLNVIRALHRKSLLVYYHIDSFHDDEVLALTRERHLIQKIGRHDLGRGPLTNQTDGGEGSSNPSEESRQRRRDTLSGENAEEPERQLANSFFQRLCSVKSVPIKPIGRYRIEGLWQNRDRLNMKPRQAAALVASAIANRVLLRPGALIPRRMIVEGADLIVENGVGRDILSSKMAALGDGSVGKEILALTSKGYTYIVNEIDSDMLVDAGILMPQT